MFTSPSHLSHSHGQCQVAAVFVVSPTYEGACSDVTSASRACHAAGVPLVVDEAHGAHLAFLEAPGDGQSYPLQGTTNHPCSPVFSVLRSHFVLGTAAYSGGGGEDIITPSISLLGWIPAAADRDDPSHASRQGECRAGRQARERGERDRGRQGWCRGIVGPSEKGRQAQLLHPVERSGETERRERGRAFLGVTNTTFEEFRLHIYV